LESHHDRDLREHKLLVRITGGLVVAAGVTFGLVRFVSGEPAGQNLEAAVGAIAFGSVIAAPGVLALFALHDRPALPLPAALLLVPLSFLSFALVTLPLLIPAYLLLRTYAHATPEGSGWRVAATTSVVLVFLVAAVVALFAHEDPREFVTETAFYATSDVVTYLEAALSLALTGIGVGAGWLLARPGTRDA
jgi:hypothetical protein